MLDQFQLEKTRMRFEANASRRARNEKLIREGRLLQVDTPERVNKFLARRGIVGSPTGLALAGRLQPGGEELGTRPGEVLERIIGTSDLMGVAFLERGLQVARSVGRVWVNVNLGRPDAFGTGFLVSPRLLLTNHHVLGDKVLAGRSLVQFDYALKASGSPYPTAMFAMDPETFHIADRNLDYALVAVKLISQEGRALSDFGWNRLFQEEGKAIAAQFANIVQHPNGEMKQLTLRENRIVDVLPEFLHYTADTLGGSSGSPVYNDRWEVVALHHSGIWKTNAAGQPLTADGTVWQPEMGEDKIQWLYNEGARVSSLVTHIQQQPLDASRQPLVREMLDKSPNSPIEATASSVTSALSSGATPQPAQPQTGIATWTIPLNVAVSIGNVANLVPQVDPRSLVPTNQTTAISVPPSAPGARESDVLAAAKQSFTRPGVLGVRMGFVFKDGEITKERAIVVTVPDKKPLLALRESGVDPLPSSFQGFPLEVTGPTVRELIAFHNGPAGNELFGRLQTIAEEIKYVPPAGVKLEKVTAQMRVIAHASPDIGWPTLKEFLGDTRTRLVVGMYDFGAKHIVDAIKAMGKKSGFNKMTLTMREHGSLDNGVKENDLDNADAAKAIEKALKSKFECAFVKIGQVNGWVAKSYHIKVAVRDAKAFWLSSGNWQSSNQADIAPMDDHPPKIGPLRTYNREWHIIIEHADLAKTLQEFLLNDFKNNPLSTEEALLPPLPDLFIPITAPDFGLEAAPVFEYFEPLDKKREFTVTPLLTPDDFAKPVTALINEAETEILVQNQTFNAPETGQEELTGLIDAIIEKQQQGVTVRVIIRSFHAADDRANLELLTQRGLKPGTVKFQKNSHTKGVIIDRKKVLVGSQNWSQLGVSLNRDASLLFEDPDLAKYFGRIFDHDWKNLATSKIGPEGRSARVARPEESTPPGYVRVNASALLDPS
jgi:V8-like Glu-specific endopeptidase